MLTYENPVVDRDFPDPGVFYDDASSQYFAYATNGNGLNIQCWTSRDFVEWHEHGEVLPGPFPPWTGKPGFMWAPEVCKAPQGRPGYLMYVSCHDFTIKPEVMCIGVAYAETPRGPFRFIMDRPLLQAPGGVIDPQPFDDPVSGKRFLVFKNDGDGKMYTKETQLWVQKLGDDGLSVVGDRFPLLSHTEPWQHGLLEAPYLTYNAPSRTYCLFFSSGFFGCPDYCTGYALSSSLTGPYKVSRQPLLFTDELRAITGPGGACVVRGALGHPWMAFHAHDERGGGGGRRMCIHRMRFGADGTPQLEGRAHYRRRLRLGAEAEDDLAPEQASALPAQYFAQPGNQSAPPPPGAPPGQGQGQGARKKSELEEKGKKYLLKGLQKAQDFVQKH